MIYNNEEASDSIVCHTHNILDRINHCGYYPGYNDSNNRSSYSRPVIWVGWEKFVDFKNQHKLDMRILSIGLREI